MSELRKFDDMSEAFAYCRRQDKPVLVKVGQVTWKLFPSGKAIMQATKTTKVAFEEHQAKEMAIAIEKAGRS